MAQAIGGNSTKTNTSNTRCAELLWQVLDDTHVQALVSVKPAFIKVGTMGKRPIQESRHKVAETKVQGTTPTIPTLAIGTSIM